MPVLLLSDPDPAYLPAAAFGTHPQEAQKKAMAAQVLEKDQKLQAEVAAL